MQFRCYTCTFLLHDGIPPLEALSETQQSVIGIEIPEGDRRLDALRGTEYEGMSVYSFCAFCFMVITEFPSRHSAPCHIEYTRTRDWHETVQFVGRECDIHGEIGRVTVDMSKNESFDKWDDVHLTRLAMFHKIEQVYKTVDLSRLAELRDLQI